MATVEYWIQLEYRYWDTMPNNIDRMTGRTAAETLEAVMGCTCGYEDKTITSPETGASRTVKMYAPLRNSEEEAIYALIYRRYTKDWASPDDRKINPWDINEPDPTDTGTMGTIPGPIVECNVGDTVIVHFRNKDMRINKKFKSRAHSMHVHGFVFKAEHDGAYPLSPEDKLQSIPADERSAWDEVGVTGDFKKGDRVPPGGTFDYTWQTFLWGSTAGVWLYHDHAICDTENVLLGAIGMVVIHNPADENDFTIGTEDLPDGDFNGSPTRSLAIHFDQELAKAEGKTRSKTSLKDYGYFSFELSDDSRLNVFNLKTYRTPPAKALYLQLFHTFGSSASGDEYHMCINGRSFLGNTPSLVAGSSTKMRFGVVGMGEFEFHTFHIHGHRWILPGADGTKAIDIQKNPQTSAVSQFEDTRIFGPANSFVFTIDNTPPFNDDGTINVNGSFMRAGGPNLADNKGEWHMHCHVLDHMMMGMMGSLLIVDGGDVASLPEGEPCDYSDSFSFSELADQFSFPKIEPGHKID